MVVAGYLLYDTNMKVQTDEGMQFVGLPNGPPNNGMKSTALNTRERADLVFRLVEERIKNLVIVNKDFSSFDMIQACAEVAEGYANNVMVVPPLLARITYALEVLSNLHNPPKDEVILVVTIALPFAEFVVLRRDQHSELHVVERETCNPGQCNSMFAAYFGRFSPDSTIFLVDGTIKYVADELQDQFNPAFCYIRCYNKWDYMLLYGAVLRAMDDEDGFDSRYHIANFSNGFEARANHGTVTLLPDRSPLPCNIYGLVGEPQLIHLLYFEEYCHIGKELTFKKDRNVRPLSLQVSGSSEEVIAYIDARGVPYIPLVNGAVETKDAELSEEKFNVVLSVEKSSDLGKYSPPSSLVTNLHVATLQFSAKFLFCNNFYAIEVFQNGHARFLPNSLGNKWTPMYLSMAKGTIVLGNIAKTHSVNFPKSVIYDVLKVIGKPFNEIKIDPKWGFKLINGANLVYFQIETPSGTLAIPQEILLAAFLKAMKLQAETYLNAEIKISTKFKLTESQKSIFKKAAAKINLEILSFVSDIGQS